MGRRTLACVVLLLAANLAGATTLVKMGFGDLARDADAVVVGTVISVDGEWGPNLNFIRSNVTVQVERRFRGPDADTVVLRNPGGIVGGEGQRAHGAAEFEVGEKVLLFLTTWEDGTPKVLGYGQGKSRVVFDELNQERLVGGSAHGHLLEGAAREIEHGPKHNIALQPAR